MTRVHQYVGISAYVLILLHPALLLLGGLQVSWVQALQAIWPAALNPVYATGWGALLLMMLALASTFAYKLPYRLWRVLHALLGIVVITASWHLLEAAQAEFSLALMLMAALLLAWRVMRIDAGLAARDYTITRVEPLTPDTIEITLSCVDPAAPSVGAGELVFIGFRWHTCGGRTGEFHPFTVSGSDGAGSFSVAIKALGDHTRELQALQAGVAARVQGAFPGFLAPERTGPELWIAAGIGITPFIAALRSGSLTWPTRLVYLFHDEHMAPYVDELKRLQQQHPQLHLHLASTGHGRPALATLVPAPDDIAQWTCYLCGPQALTSGLIAALKSKGFHSRQIHFEKFDYR